MSERRCNGASATEARQMVAHQTIEVAWRSSGHGQNIVRHRLASGQPVVSVDTKKKEQVGDFGNGGREWQPSGEPERTLVHDFPSDGHGKAIPYGVYDMARNEAWVSVGCDHDTPAVAVASLRQWWTMTGSAAYPQATMLYNSADAGGSNAHRSRAFKHALQGFADDTGM